MWPIQLVEGTRSATRKLRAMMALSLSWGQATVDDSLNSLTPTGQPQKVTDGTKTPPGKPNPIKVIPRKKPELKTVKGPNVISGKKLNPIRPDRPVGWLPGKNTKQINHEVGDNSIAAKSSQRRPIPLEKDLPENIPVGGSTPSQTQPKHALPVVTPEKTRLKLNLPPSTCILTRKELLKEQQLASKPIPPHRKKRMLQFDPPTKRKKFARKEPPANQTEQKKPRTAAGVPTNSHDDNLDFQLPPDIPTRKPSSKEPRPVSKPIPLHRLVSSKKRPLSSVQGLLPSLVCHPSMLPSQIVQSHLQGSSRSPTSLLESTQGMEHPGKNFAKQAKVDELEALEDCFVQSLLPTGWPEARTKPGELEHAGQKFWRSMFRHRKSKPWEESSRDSDGGGALWAPDDDEPQGCTTFPVGDLTHNNQRKEACTHPSSCATSTTLQWMELLNKDGRIGIYLPEARKERIARFHAKRKMRIWRKQIKYDCRKKSADSRPRIKGRFVKRQEERINFIVSAALGPSVAAGEPSASPTQPDWAPPPVPVWPGCRPPTNGASAVQVQGDRRERNKEHAKNAYYNPTAAVAQHTVRRELAAPERSRGETATSSGENSREFHRPREPSPEELEGAKTARARAALSTWYQRLEDLYRYRRNHGHCNVPQKYEELPELGIWVNKQRMEKKAFDEEKKNSMSVQKINALNVLGFQWAKRKGQAAWNEKYEELVVYKRRHGDCQVPTKYNENPALGRWVSTQRSNYKEYKEGDKSKMTDERKTLLEDLGFRLAKS